MRIIDADAFHESIFQRYCKNCNNQAHRMCHACWVMNMIDELEEAPTINPEDLRPKGKWIDFSEPDTPAWDRVYRCSNCGKIVVYHNFVLCPECGAKMEE